MTTTTISLERSAYELLKAHKKAEESFSEAVHRLLGGASPDLRGFLDIVPLEDGATIAAAIESIREEDLNQEQTKARRGRQKHGRRT
ncbi:MAG: antitoxin VapB family protein [Thermoplasmata archaeon]|nr:antitoxin VapB family protein [Thermoplasmata archaeon]